MFPHIMLVPVFPSMLLLLFQIRNILLFLSRPPLIQRGIPAPDGFSAPQERTKTNIVHIVRVQKALILLHQGLPLHLQHPLRRTAERQQ